MLERKSHISEKLDYKYTFNTEKTMAHLPTRPISGDDTRKIPPLFWHQMCA